MTAAAKTDQRGRQPSNGNAPAKETHGTAEEAVAQEQQLADEAAKIRGEATELDAALFLKLWPLLRRPIPGGFVISTGSTTGKPYDSTGVKSVQVLIDRMDNILTPLWWRDKVEYSEEGKVACVTVTVGPDDAPYVRRQSMGGMDRGSTRGNLLKGSYTNAAKLAFARVGPGHEIYVGVADLDPDVNQQVAEQQGRESTPAARQSARHVALPKDGITEKLATEIVDRAADIGIDPTRLYQAATHYHGDAVPEWDSKATAIVSLRQLTSDQGQQLDDWISRKADQGADDGS